MNTITIPLIQRERFIEINNLYFHIERHQEVYFKAVLKSKHRTPDILKEVICINPSQACTKCFEDINIEENLIRYINKFNKNSLESQKIHFNMELK